MRSLIFCFIVLFPLTNKAQNLVLNPGFEQHTCQSWLISSIEMCENWSSPTPQTPDYFNNLCEENKAATFPDKNWWGSQVPKNGIAYAGFIAYRPNSDEPSKSISEYLQVKLSEPLRDSITYTIRINISLAECSSISLRELNAAFAKEEVKEKSLHRLKLFPQVTFTLINDTSSWITLEETFIATGEEQFLIIGLFDVKKKIKTDRVKPSPSITGPRNEAYYFIDDVSVFEKEVHCFESVRETGSRE